MGNSTKMQSYSYSRQLKRLYSKSVAKRQYFNENRSTTRFQRKFLKFFDRLTPVMPRLSFSRFAPALRASLYAASLNALYAATLCALTSLPRKARREPMNAYAYEAPSLALAYDTPPFA